MDLARPQVAVEALLECPVCMDQFETSGPRIPKMLPCQHSFCCECVKNIHDGTRLACPSCRKVFYMPPDDLPNTFILLQLLDINASEKRKTELQCERYDDRRKPSLETPRPVVQPEKMRTEERASSRPIMPYILVTALICFGTGFLFSIFYVLLAKNATVFGRTIMKNIPEVFNFAKIILFHIFDVIYHFLVQFYVILPSFFRIIFDFSVYVYEILSQLLIEFYQWYRFIRSLHHLFLGGYFLFLFFKWILSNHRRRKRRGRRGFINAL